MGTIDDLPPQNPVLRIEDAAEIAFEESLRHGGRIFDFQHKDRRDYGTDYQLELISNDQRTNFRVHVQLKGTETHPNSDGSISISVPRSNLNYLITQPSSIYVCYNIQDKRLLVRTADDVFRMYARSSQDNSEWMNQKSVTVRFSEPFDVAFQQRLHVSVLANGRGTRDRRIAWSVTPPEKSETLVKAPLLPIPVPLEKLEARELLKHLYKNANDEAISASFDQFFKVLDDDKGALDLIYMAEINLGLNGKPFRNERIQDSIKYFSHELTQSSRSQSQGSLLYTLGNAWSALRVHEKALISYNEALENLTHPSVKLVAAQCWKNLGSTLSALGRNEEAKTAYEKALSLEPNLPEAHLALGLWFEQHGGDPNLALEHLEHVSKHQGSALSMRAVDARRAKILFQLGEDRHAFQTINSIIGAEQLGDWEWKWCAMLVSEHGSKTTASAKKALTFWRSFLSHHPNDKHALAAEFNCLWQLHQEGEDTTTTFKSFERMAQKIVNSKVDDAAHVWDRVGHWAQQDGDWISAESAYRRAAELDPVKYGYCLGVALNHLDRFSEALSALLPDNENFEPDALILFQAAFALEQLGDPQGAIEKYSQALMLDPDYALIYFNLGGIFWNNHDIANALLVWSEAIRRFPEHELTLKLRTDFPDFFGT